MPSFWLEYVQDGQRREFSFDSASVSIGRDKGSDFVLDHPTVSRQHALIVSNPQGHQLVVLSRGGLTAIDGGQVSGEIELFDGSQIHFGQLAFTFRSRNAPRRPEQGQPPQGWEQAQQPQQPQQQGGGAWQPQQQQVGAQGSGAQWAGPQQQSGPQPTQSGGWNQPQMGGSPSSSWEQPSGANPAANRQSGQYGAPATGNFGQSTGNFSQPQNGGSAFDGGGWDSQVGGEDEWGDPGAGDDAGLMSWDEIAASADAHSEVEVDAASAALSDFEKIKNAQEEAEKKSKGNPIIKFGGLAAIIALVGVIVYTEFRPPPEKDEPGKIKVDNAPPEIDWKKEDLDCVGKANCEAAALQAYKVGADLCEQIDSQPGNRYKCFKQFTKAEELLAKGGVEEAPAEMEGYVEAREKIAPLLQSRFQQLRANIYSDKKLKMWGNVVDKLDQVKSTFPDPRCNYHQWAVEQERKMKEAGTYPQQTYVP